MSANFIAQRAAGDFSSWAVATSTSDLNLVWEPTCVADFLYAWLESGHGVRACHGDFTTFLAAIPLIIEEWLKHGPTMNYVEYLDLTTLKDDEDDAIIHERPVATIFPESGGGFSWLVLDRAFFDRCTFHELHGPYVAPS